MSDANVVKRRNTEVNVVEIRTRRDGTREFGPDPNKPRAPRWNNQMTAIILLKTEELEPERWWEMPELSHLNFRSRSTAYQVKTRRRVATLRKYVWTAHRRVLVCEYEKIDNAGHPLIKRVKLATQLEREVAKSEVEGLLHRRELSAAICREMLDHLDVLAPPLAPPSS